MKPPCAVCGSPSHAKSLCRPHYDAAKAGREITRPQTKHGEPGKWLVSMPDTDKCLDWPYGKNSEGRPYWNGKRVNRITCAMANGAPPTKHHEAAHLCGREVCVNPRHLVWKTSADNKADWKFHAQYGRGAVARF